MITLFTCLEKTLQNIVRILHYCGFIAAVVSPAEPEPGHEPQVPAAVHQHGSLQQLARQVQGHQERLGRDVQTGLWLWQAIRSGEYGPIQT